MPARRCSLCGINYPTMTATGSVLLQCPVHNEPTTLLLDDQPDDDWAQQAARLVADMASELAAGVVIPDLDDETLYIEDGRAFVHSWDLVERGFGHRLPDGTLLRIAKTTYEVLG